MIYLLFGANTYLCTPKKERNGKSRSNQKERKTK